MDAAEIDDLAARTLARPDDIRNAVERGVSADAVRDAAWATVAGVGFLRALPVTAALHSIDREE